MIIRIDFDIFVGEIAGPDRAAGRTFAELDLDGKFAVFHEFGELAFGRACIQSAADHGRFIEIHRHVFRPERGSGITGGRQDAAPVGIAAEPCRLAQRGIGDGPGGKLGVAVIGRAGNFHADEFGNAFAVVYDRAGEMLRDHADSVLELPGPLGPFGDLHAGTAVRQQEDGVVGAHIVVHRDLVERGIDRFFDNLGQIGIFSLGVDWEMNGEWGAIGWLSREKDCGAVLVSYSYRVRRLDAIVRRADGSVACVKGAGHVANPAMPPLAPGDTLLAAVYVDAQSVRLTDENLFPVQAETANPFHPVRAVRHAGLSKTLAKLRAGGKVKILAWGDSVTDGFWLERGERWQEQFVAWLGREYPGAEIELVSNGWPGKKSASFLRESPESPRNFEKSVLDIRPDLVVSEFVNDASGGAGIVDEIYAGKILPAFRERGVEWVILAPHYVRPDMMGLGGQKNCDDDPRPFVHALRAFALREGVALADASRLWGALWRRGIPYQTHLVNDINHPDAFGMSLFVEALKPFFAKETP